ncbi:MAG: hypothetical protein ACOH1X_02305 [Kaistella sp.]
MNARILDLIKDPELIEQQDLVTLTSELKIHPYLQSIRALHLLGIHKFNPENYQQELSTVAAYTTDKKILYQFINKKKEVEITENSASIEETEDPKENAVPEVTYNDVPFEPAPAAEPVFVDGELNRVLFKGEEDFLERESETIDIEATFESGKIITQSGEQRIETPLEELEAHEIADSETIETEEIENLIQADELQEAVPEKTHESEVPTEENSVSLDEVKIQKTENLVFQEAKDAETFSREKIVDENDMKEEESTLKSAEISFHGLDEFLPDVRIEPTNIKEENFEIPKNPVSKHEAEMQRLIAEVEAKVKASKKEKTPEEKPVENSKVNFSETQKFQVSKDEKINEKKSAQEIEEKPVEEKSIPESKSEQKAETPEPVEIKTEIPEIAPEQNKTPWKPMSFSANTPDALIQKNAEVRAEKVIKAQETQLQQKAQIEIPDESISEKVSAVSQEAVAVEKVKEIAPVTSSNPSIETVESNVTTFINTWQNWLKIERQEPKIEEKIAAAPVVEKNTIIEKFIEKEPRISKLKEDSEFVAKERGTNISHLMTETLAQLYVEQKLYAKAIKAYEILTKKHPQKEELYNEKIQAIKESRKNP